MASCLTGRFLARPPDSMLGAFGDGGGAPVLSGTTSPHYSSMGYAALGGIYRYAGVAHWVEW